MRLIQISDAHLPDSPAEWVQDYPTYRSLAQVLAVVKQYSPDLLLCTGDISNDGGAASYALWHQLISSLGVPVYTVPGNHDRYALSIPSITLGGWRILLLDSVYAQAHWGEGMLGDTTLTWLVGQLQSHPHTPTLIALHHHPIPINHPELGWIDQMGLSDGATFLATIAPYAQIKGVLFGHIHRAFTWQWQQLQFLGCPSTCYQVIDATEVGEVTLSYPGFRMLDLDDRGNFLSAVIRVPFEARE